MNKPYICTSGGGFSLSPENEKAALEAGCIGSAFGARFPEGCVTLGWSTIGWTGVYLNGRRIFRFRNFNRALRVALIAARVASE